jgi:hypothetical protein
LRESPSTIQSSTGASRRTTARSESGSSPTSLALLSRPSGRLTTREAAFDTTWLLVST